MNSEIVNSIDKFVSDVSSISNTNKNDVGNILIESIKKVVSNNKGGRKKNEETTEVKEEPKKKGGRKKKEETKEVKEEPKKKQKISDILKKDEEKLSSFVKREPMLKINRNSFGNYEHRETRLVFDPSTKEVIGKQEPDGKITELTVEDIQMCREYSFDYKIPDIIKRNDLIEIKKTEIEELDEQFCESDCEEEDEEEELE